MTRGDGGIEAAPDNSRNAMANLLLILLNIDFVARNISLYLTNSIPAKDAVRLKLGCWCYARS